jgi:beta-glucosidase-like glycosyl hydrolase/CubicO group peptidase (beta-lactamase class C family)
MVILKKTIWFAAFLIVAHTDFAQGIRRSDSLWADSVFRSLSKEEKIGQLFMIRAWSWKDSTYRDSLCSVAKTSQPGGFCFFKGTPYAQASLTNRLQEILKVPPLIAIDAEWGLGMRLDSAFSFPRPMTLGASEGDKLEYLIASKIAQDCRRLGVHMNFAPVADINNNPGNPVINFRSFGEDRKKVAAKSLAYMKGLQDNGVMAVGKHFPGHGDTQSDSHLTLPIINHDPARMDSLELYPFKALIDAGIWGIMTAHLYLPKYDSGVNAASTLSYEIVTRLLKEKLGFKGFAITDALDMQGVAKFFKPGEIELKALLAGNDILLLPQHIQEAIRVIRDAADSNLVSWSAIDRQCFRILMLKSGLGAKGIKVNTSGLYADLNSRSSLLLQKQAFAASLTLVKNDLGTLPLIATDKRKVTSLALGSNAANLFQKRLNDYAGIPCYRLPKHFSRKEADSLIACFKGSDIVLVSLHNMTGYPTDTFNLSREMLQMADSVSRLFRTVTVIFGNPYSMSLFNSPSRSESVIVAYQDFPVTEALAAEAVFGGIAAGGHLPVTAGPFRAGRGETTFRSRFSFVLPEEIGLNEESLKKIDSIAESGVRLGAYPGCQILLAKNGKVFYQKSFGHPQTSDTITVANDDLYDIASVTKIAATTLAVMKLCDAGLLSPGDSLGKFLDGTKGTNKSGITVREIMTHSAGLQAWIPFYKSVVKNGQWDPAVLSRDSSSAYPLKVAENCFITRAYSDSIYQAILRSSIGEKGKYLYSDLGFYLLRLVVEKISGKTFEAYLDENFYRPLGLRSTLFNPYRHENISSIMPTENDTVFRNQMIRGFVHDPGAAMLGGISGHAGLFSNALELGVIIQMLLDEGSYGGKQFISPATVKLFTSRQFPGSGNRRGLGFDKPLQTYRDDSPACRSASDRSFGHSGFTGTYTWADPENGLVYVFLSNRVCPDASNQKLKDLNIRTNLHQAVYDLFEQFGIK